MAYVLEINEGKLEEMRLTKVQKYVLWAIVDIAEETHDYTVCVVNQEITDQLNLKSSATVGKVLNKLVDNGLLIRRSANCYKFNTEYAEFEEVDDTERFRSLSEWLQDPAFSEKCIACCAAYLALIDKPVLSREKDKLVAKEFLAEKVNKYGVASVLDAINRSLYKTDMQELLSLIS